MRRKVTLYIGGRKADISDQSFFLLNYQMEDLSNPTVVKNSFSQKVTLPGTCRNNRIFAGMWRADRVSGNGGATGADFNASKRTPFALYGDDGSVLESGYLKLDKVVRKGRSVREFGVSLYGGLGAFFYELSYNADGSKKTLADLDFLGGGDGELDFTINAATVAEAWDALRYGTAEGTKWGVINFFPAYEGIPQDFDAKHALATPVAVNLLQSQTKDGITYWPDANGYSLINLPQEYDQWAVKDLRAYLQRPAWNMEALLTAIAKPVNNGGYEFDWSAIASGTPINPHNKWVTRPLLASLGSFKQVFGGLTTSYTGASSATPATVAISGVDDLPTGTKINASMTVKCRMTASGGAASLALYKTFPGYIFENYNTVIFLQAVGYDGGGNAIAGGPVQVLSGPISRGYYNADQIAGFCNFRPVFGNNYGSVIDGQFDLVSGTTYEYSSAIGLSVEGYAMETVKVHASIFAMKTTASGAGALRVRDVDPVTAFTATLYDGDTAVSATAGTLTEGSTLATYTSPQSLRTGARFGKRSVLSTAHTPAEYLLAYAKIMGLYFIYDKAERKVSLVPRNGLFVDETIDLTGRVDTGQDVDIVPMAFSARWYDFRQDVVPGAFAQEYKNNYGRDYGMQRVNTGYDFDASSVDLLGGIALRAAANVLEHGPYFYDVTYLDAFVPSPFVDPGFTYSLYNAGKAEAFPVPALDPACVLEPWNEYFPGYDGQGSARYIYDKLQFHDGDGKPVDGADVLAAHIANIPSHCKLSDDVPSMDTLNAGKPCWLLNPPSEAQYIPQLTRYDIETGLFLDFGEPSELDFPQMYYDAEDTIYDRLWKAYMRDRYDKDTKVMTCKVDLSGLQVGQDLLRKFYWFDNSLWTLNKITNHSLTTYGPTECEFVQVRDKDNYLNGQTY